MVMHVFLRSASILLAASMFMNGACSDNDSDNGPQPLLGFAVSPLLSDQSGAATNVDPNLVNAWGLAMDSQSFWIANNGTGVISVVAADGTPSKFSPPSSALNVEPGITGIISNPTNSFQIGASNNTAPATMLVASESGRIFAINPSIAATPQLVIDRSSAGANYKGLTIYATSGGAIRLAAADFHNGRVDVFDGEFKLLSEVTFVDPLLNAGLAPWNLVTIGNNVFIMYAVQDADAEDEVAGVGNGRIDVYDVDGNFVQTILDGGLLNAPWGLVQANDAFDPELSGLLIAGNFGDGTLVTIDPRNGDHAYLLDTSGNTLVIPGLWGLMFGNGQFVGSTSSLYFASGPDDEAHGLYGRVVLTTAPVP
jgi:uncharacterized protein (TIGR03118 family)